MSSLMSSMKVIHRYTTNVVMLAINSLQIIMMISPTPDTIPYLRGLDHTSSKPSLAAMQKFLPRIAI